jgi:Kef-type K+ transport system membrane component KefB
MGQEIFTGLSIIIWVVLIALWIMKLLKQPMIIWYIIAGTVISIFLPNLLNNNAEFQNFATIWVSLLLFMVWIELNPLLIKDLWKTSVIAWFLQVLITSIIWFWISYLLWFDITTSVYLWVGLSFSSTIVVMKLLTDKWENESTFGRLSIWILIIQDLLVMLILLWIVSIKWAWNIGILIWWLILKLVLLWWSLFLISKYIIPRITSKIAESQEYLFLFAIWRCFILWTVFHILWFSIEIGTLIAWITLATSTYRFEIISKIRSLRDFFIVIFFVLLWSQIDFWNISKVILPAIVLTIFALIIKPIITMAILWLMGHTKKNSFLTWWSLGQISEFSFLFITMWLASWALKDTNLISIITIVWFISIAWSSYFIDYWEKMYKCCKWKLLKYIPWSWNKEYKKINKEDYDVILFWYWRFGGNLYDVLAKKHERILVIDEKPWIISYLQKHKIPCIYWDVWDIDFLQELNLKETKMIISTVRSFEENVILLKTIKYVHRHVIIVLVSNHVEESIKLYELWADYVILPHYIWVDHTSLMLEEYWFDINKFMENKKMQVHELKWRHSDMMIEMLQKSI